MKRFVLFSCAYLLAAPVAAQTGTADKKLLKETARTMVEDRTRQDFEEAKNKVSQRDKDAMDAIKILFYNKAYIYYACIVSIGREKFSDKTIAECVQEPMKELIAGSRNAKEYSKNSKSPPLARSAGQLSPPRANQFRRQGSGAAGSGLPKVPKAARPRSGS